MSRKGEIDLFKCHPQLILITRTPYTFEGFISLPKVCGIHGRNLMKIKLIVPYYPTLEDMDVYFSKNFKQYFNSDLKELIHNSIRNDISLHSFLNRLKEYFTLQTKNQCDRNCTSEDSNIFVSIKSRLSEVKNLLLQSSEIKVSSNHNLSSIKLTANGVSLIVESEEGNLWKITHSDIPFFTIDKSVNQLSLSNILNIFISKMQNLETIWRELKEIDENCCIVDPAHPKPCHLYRRIYLTDSLSLMISLDPSYTLGYNIPSVKFLGCESDVLKHSKDLTNRLQSWNAENSVLQNLCLLLNITEFPLGPEKDSMEVENGIINATECCICYEEELDNVQNVICNRCKKHFHLNCLRKWLETVINKPVTFGKINGECPICCETICADIK